MYNLSTLPTSAICDVQKEHEQAAFKWQKEFKTLNLTVIWVNEHPIFLCAMTNNNAGK